MSGLSRTFSEGKRVGRTTSFSLTRVAPSFERNSMEPGPGESFTEIGIKPKFFPSGWGKSRTVRSFHFAEATSAVQVRRKVSPRFALLGATKHCCPEANAGRTTRTEILNRRSLARKFIRISRLIFGL